MHELRQRKNPCKLIQIPIIQIKRFISFNLQLKLRINSTFLKSDNLKDRFFFTTWWFKFWRLYCKILLQDNTVPLLPKKIGYISTQYCAIIAFIRSTSNEIPVFVKFCLYIGDICSEITLLPGFNNLKSGRNNIGIILFCN